MKIKVLIVDDHTVVRAGIKAILSFEKDIAVVGEATDGESAVAKCAELRPNVVIMDLIMPRLSGAEATLEILKANPATKILVLTSFGSAADIRHALEDGASGALLKTVGDAQLVEAIRKVHRGEKAISPEIARELNANPPTNNFTARQLEILRHIARGLTNEDIAKVLNITVSGVKQHLAAIFAKLGAASRTEAVALALKQQILHST